MTEQISDYQRRKPVFEYHKALILQILLNDPTAHGFEGLRDDEIGERLQRRLRAERQKQGLPREERKRPTVANRLRELAPKNLIVRIKGHDGCKHNFHPKIFRTLARQDMTRLEQFYPNEKIHDWLIRIAYTEA